MRLPLLLLAAVAVLAGCPAAAADHERLGDRAYREERFADAMAEYRAAVRGGGRPRLWAKLGAAALGARDAAAAVNAFERLAGEDPTRVTEAAAGLERAAQLAERAGAAGTADLASAVRALRRVAPGRPLGRLARAPAAGVGAAEAVALFPAALASAADRRAVDSLLVAYAGAQRVTTACESAARTYRTALRRVREPAQRRAAEAGLAACALRLGLDALAAERADVAEAWFGEALRGGGASPEGWRARIGLGEARLLQGDVLGAALAWQAVISGESVPDSLVRLATLKLNALGSAEPPGAGEEVR